jgi:hypothetical protein
MKRCYYVKIRIRDWSVSSTPSLNENSIAMAIAQPKISHTERNKKSKFIWRCVKNNGTFTSAWDLEFYGDILETI